MAATADVQLVPGPGPAQSLAAKSQEFVPVKSCEQYLLEECAEVLHECKPWVPLLVQESRKIANEIVMLGKSKGLSEESTLALVCYTADMQLFGARRNQNFYHAINRALHDGNTSTCSQLRGYLHFFSRAISHLPKEHAGWTYRGLTRASFNSIQNQFTKLTPVVWPGITSVSKSQSIALSFASGKPDVLRRERENQSAKEAFRKGAVGNSESRVRPRSDGVLLRIWTTQGVSVETFSWFSTHESEMILGPNFCFVVARPLYVDANVPGVECIDLVEVCRDIKNCVVTPV